jgi:hypothetical protein
MWYILLASLILTIAITSFLLYIKNKKKLEYAKNMVFLLVKIPKKDSDLDKNNDTIQ